MKHKNQLGKEKSPYLLQHRNNPVNWFAWGSEAFEAAINQEKPIFLSIGYSTCYWCHVMEKDSFEDPEIAKLLNESFVSIKVDREERPDIDQIYMDAVTAMTGRGGWPLTALLTPDLKPFFGGTFFPKDQFSKLLTRVSAMWADERSDLVASAEEITEALSTDRNAGKTLPISEEIFKTFFSQQEGIYDKSYGGFGQAPKFPPSQALRVLLRMYRSDGSEDALRMCIQTLDNMARGGIYDQLGGGFSRYSVDERWMIPHFEKMLYDNALLTVSYLEAAQVTGSKMFASVASETLDYVIREMQDEAGGYYSAQDAGDVGKEGEFYVWDDSELVDLLAKEEYEQVCKSFNVTGHGNFEDNFTVLNFDKNTDWAEKQKGVLKSALEKLFKHRSTRRAPHIDDKILTSWNALMISAMLKGYQVCSDKRYLESAQACIKFIKAKLCNENKLFRRYRDGEARFSGYLDDYSYLIAASLDFYETDGNIDWLNWAIELQETLDDRFWDKENGGYFFTEEDGERRIMRKKEFTDGSTPSGNAISLHNLIRLYHLTYKQHYKDRAKETLEAMSFLAMQYPAALCSTLISLDFKLSEPWEIVVKAQRDSSFGKELETLLFSEFIPNKVCSWSEQKSLEEIPHIDEGQVSDAVETVFLCRNQTCGSPLTNVKDLARLLKE
jgi:uncharacterized protein YyaL (SSP411 family)